MFAYFVALIVLMFFENRLVYSVPKYDAKVWDRCREQYDAKEIFIETSTGEPATAWLFEPATAPERKRFAIFFHGSGDNIPRRSSFLRHFSDETQTLVLGVEYPGYDQHDTKSSEQGVYRNADAGMQWLCERFSIQPNDVVLMGESLGGGPAMYLAKESQSRAIVLLSTFSSLPDVAAEKYAIFPVRLVMKNRFPSLDRMRTCQQPLLQFHGDIDQIVPLKFARKLFAASPSTAKRFVEIPGHRHNDPCPDVFWTEVNSFLESLD